MKEAKLVARFVRGSQGGGELQRNQWPQLSFHLSTSLLYHCLNIFLNSKYNYLSLASLFRQLSTTVLYESSLKFSWFPDNITRASSAEAPARVPAIVTRRLVPSPFIIFDTILKGIMGKNTVNQRKQPDWMI